MFWYVVHTKPRQEFRALQNLEQQGYSCFLPVLRMQMVRGGSVEMAEEPLFPRYLFVRLDSSVTGKSWTPIRSTKGVSRLVTFGNQPARIDDTLIESLQAREAQPPRTLFTPGDRVSCTVGPFAGLEGVYQMLDGDARALVLIELLSKPVRMAIPAARLRRVE
ncbi:transcription/translation regulatory transformer protein RfaH [Lacisediminimonas profundi]|uniref:transcription/translation regulatory transformer protein RfaH n=1 Tax=Lacisediminimonas profundi TaxID=2603856 RepID=UPI00124B1EE1|nr:transcription/translation regulatory transformer protein RfaH [Lacisediminimonas profundi]